MTSKLTTLRASLLAADWSATSPVTLDDDAERIARTERQTER